MVPFMDAADKSNYSQTEIFTFLSFLRVCAQRLKRCENKTTSS